ncbi:hypothetical protein CMK18_23875 [Candidatus Poribacteria bacterium]|nr:hypothetical protein [Candidatus Poribacteria bacterium]
MPDVTLNILQTIGRDAGELSSKEFIEQLNRIPETVDNIYVDINSEGGSVFEGNAIAQALKSHPANITTRCIGSALSIASVIFLAGDERLIAENGWIMIHEPMSESWGTASEIRQQADLIDSIRVKMVDEYNAATNISSAQVAQMMKDETWFDSSDAIQYGFASGVTGKALAVAMSSKTKYKNMPLRLLASKADAPSGDDSQKEDLKMSEMKTIGQTIAAIRARCRGADDKFILAQLEAGTSLDDITAVHNEDQRKELEELKQALAIAEATIAEYEEEMAQEEDEPKPDSTEEELAEEEIEEVEMEEEEEEEEEVEAEEEEEELVEAKNSIRPVATRIRKKKLSATYTAKWNQAIQETMDRASVTRDRAIKMVNRDNPGLREKVVNESNLNLQRNVAV